MAGSELKENIFKTTVDAFPHAVDLRDRFGYLPIFNVVREGNTPIFAILVKPNLDNLILPIIDEDGLNRGTAIHLCIYDDVYSILDYIRSVKPQSFCSLDDGHPTLLALMVEDHIGKVYVFSWIECVNRIYYATYTMHYVTA